MCVVVHPGVDAVEWRELDHSCSPDSLGGVVGRLRLRRPRQDQRRYANGCEYVTDVELLGRAEGGQCGAWAEAAAHMPDEPLTKSLVVGYWGRPLVRELLEKRAL